MPNIAAVKCPLVFFCPYNHGFCGSQNTFLLDMFTLIELRLINSRISIKSKVDQI